MSSRDERRKEDDEQFKGFITNSRQGDGDAEQDNAESFEQSERPTIPLRDYRTNNLHVIYYEENVDAAPHKQTGDPSLC